MEIGLFFSILGVILTLVFGVPVVVEWYRNRRRVQLSFVHESSVSLFKSYVKNIKNMEILYHGSPIDQSIYALKGYIHNSGRTDIDDKMIHAPLSVVLPNESQWLEVNIVGKSESVNVDYTIDKNRIVFKWDLLKPGEIFCFESLYKSNNDEAKYSFEHRITNLGNIQIEKVSEFAKINKPKIQLRPLYPLVFIFIISLIDVYNLYRPKIIYNFNSHNSIYSGDSLTTKNGNLYLDTFDNREVIFKKDVIDNYKLSIDINKAPVTWRKVLSKFIAVIIVLVLAAILLPLAYYSERRKYRKATKFIEAVSGKQ